MVAGENRRLQSCPSEDRRLALCPREAPQWQHMPEALRVVPVRTAEYVMNEGTNLPRICVCSILCALSVYFVWNKSLCSLWVLWCFGSNFTDKL